MSAPPESHTRCPRCDSTEVFTEPARCDLDDRPQVLALVCESCSKRFRVAANHPDSEGVFWRAATAHCPACAWHDGIARPYGSNDPFPCPQCGAKCGVFNDE